MNDDLFGERLGAALREHSPHTAPAVLDLGTVKGRARGIRRRRTATGSAAAAVALLAASPFAVSTLAGNDDEPLPPATSPTPSQVPEVNLPGKITLAKDAPADRGTAADWFIRNTELSDQFPFPARAQEGLTRVGDRWLVSYQTAGDYSLYSIALGAGTDTGVDVDEAVAQAETFDLHDEVVVSDGGDLAAFSKRSGELVLIGEGGRTRVVAQLPSPATPIDLVGDADCLTGSDCEVVVSYNDGTAPEVVRGDGTRTVLDADAVAVTAADADLVVTRGPEPAPGENPCSTVRDRTTLKVVWRSCEVSVKSFSPDGRFAVVKDAYGDGLGTVRVGLVEALTGKQLTWIEVDAQEGFVRDVAWTPQGDLEVSSHTLSDRSWRLHHVALDGEVGQRTQAQTGTEDAPPWVPVTQP